MPNIDYLNLNETSALTRSIDEPRDLAIILLFLNTGLFLSELIDLKIDAIDWEKKMVAVTGDRQRQIPLNDQVFEALARWSKERMDSSSSHFFVTTKGKVKELSDRAVDKLIRKYASKAGIRKKVNAQILRNTFAVNLFRKDIAMDKATAILGITDSQSINRYIQAAKQPATIPQAEEVEHLDNRSAVSKFTSRLFPTKPKKAKAITKIKGAIEASPEEVIFGRDGMIREIQADLNKGQAVLLVGPLGVGKTHILKYLSHRLPSVYIASPTPIKNMLIQICDKLGVKLKTRASTKDIVEAIKNSKGTNPPILIIDNLNRLKVSDVDALLVLLENFAILSASAEISPKLKHLWWKFKQVELHPLSDSAAKELIHYLTQNLSISDYEMLENRILTLSNRLPLAIVDMVHQVSHRPVVTRDVVREMYHEAGIKYRDWTSVVIFLWAIIIACRFIALGTHNFEGYILAGFGLASVGVLRYFVFRMR
ncbi:MAG: tyrosine-type recombinase/integrase [Candidatus Saganbacteria bacterium]|nr:tyrosine-type recombinase/integrase [Candidatus Saganbacteria bacterium]